MSLIIWFTALLLKVVLFCHEAEPAITAFGSMKPSNPSSVKEGDNINLRWNYTIDGSIGSATFSNVTDSVDVLIAVKFGGKNVTVAAGFQERFRADISDTLAQLTILTVQRSDRGKYKVEIITTKAFTINNEVMLIVQYPPKINHISDNQTVNEDDIVILNCTADGEPKPNIAWTKVPDNSPVNFPLTITGKQNEGLYRCTADNGIGNFKSRDVFITVHYPPKILTLASEYEVAAQESLSLDCQAEGNPQPTYTWTPCEPQQSVCNNRKLNVPGARNYSVFTYTCKVANALGNDTRNTSVFIASEVINVTLVITSESCTNGEDNQALGEKLRKKIDEVFANKIGYKSVQLKDISCGSVVVDVALKFSSIVREINVLSILEEAVKNGDFGDFNVSAIIATRHDTETTTAATTPTSPSDSETTWIIVGAVLGSLVVVAVVVAVIAWCVRKKRKCNRKDTKVHSSESQEQGTVANPPSVTYDTVEQSRKGQREVGKDTPTVSYAVVDKSKQKKKEKKPKPGELQYAELAEINPRSQGMPRSSASRGQGHPTETQYADVNAM